MSISTTRSKPAAPARRRTRRRKTVVDHLIMVAVSILVLVPLYWMITTSLRPLRDALTASPADAIFTPTFENYLAAFAAAPFVQYTVNTLIVAIVTSTTSVLLGALCGYALVRGRFRGRTILLALLLLGSMIPAEAIFIPNYVLIQRLGLYDTLLAVMLPWLTTPFAIYLYRQAFTGVAPSLFEAAEIDGASESRMLWQIAFPLARASTITIFVIQFVWSWNALLWPLLVTASTDTRVIQVGLLSFSTEGGVQIGLLMAAATASVIPIAIVFLLTQRFIIRGIAQGAVK
jgi:multiple sugar transport system permease protein